MKFAAQKAAARTVDEDEYSSMVDVKNENKTDKIDASGIDAAVDARVRWASEAPPPSSPQTIKPRSRLSRRGAPQAQGRTAWLKMSQYNEALSKMWKKDPTNPANFAPPGK